MFTENQTRQLYVVKNAITTGNVTNQSAEGTTKLAKVMLDQTTPGNDFYFLHKGASADGLQRSDVINKCQIMSVSATDAADLRHPMKKIKIELNPNVSATPVSGQDYILNVTIKNYVASGDDSQKLKFGAAKAFSNVADDLYKALAINLAKNFGREPVKMIKITLLGDANNTEITANTKASDLSAITATGIILEEVEQPWRLGAARVEYVNFEVNPSTIYVNQMDQVWGTVTEMTPTTFLPNSKKVAEMEYYFHKNRGDVYGYDGWPNNIDTQYMVNPAYASGYSFLDIHFYLRGNSHNIGHSEKTLTLVGDKTELNKLVQELETNILTGTNTVVKKSTSW